MWVRYCISSGPRSEEFYLNGSGIAEIPVTASIQEAPYLQQHSAARPAHLTMTGVDGIPLFGRCVCLAGHEPATISAKNQNQDC
jgi:hypothetical protein